MMTSRVVSLMLPAVLIFLCASVPAAPALADPPRLVLAKGDGDHGYRGEHRRGEDEDEDEHEHGHGHHHHRYAGYGGYEWDDDYGVIEGRCNRAAVGAVVGAVIGGAVGSQVSGDRNRPIAIVVGAILGSVVGGKIGRDMDDADRGCIGHALELARDGQSVRWMNERTHVNYVVTPVGKWSRGGDSCREFSMRTSYGQDSRLSRGHACRSNDGVWRMR